MPINADLDKILDKAYEEKSLSELVDAPVDALSGVSEGDAKLLQEAFNIKTVHSADLGHSCVSRSPVTQLCPRSTSRACRARPARRAAGKTWWGAVRGGYPVGGSGVGW